MTNTVRSTLFPLFYTHLHIVVTVGRMYGVRAFQQLDSILYISVMSSVPVMFITSTLNCGPSRLSFGGSGKSQRLPLRRSDC